MKLEAQLALLPDRLSAHLSLTLLALAIGAGLSIPLSLLALRWPRLRWPLLTAAGVIQTVPSLALLALMVPALDWLRTHVHGGISAFGFAPAAIALVLYSLLPMVRSLITGLTGVEPTLLEAARGLGLSPTQVLLKVQVPLAMPVILSGLRTATVLTVGVATLSTPVGQRSLGNYLFAGLQTRNWAAVLVGCVAAASLAVVLDGALALLETGLARRSRVRLLLAAAVLSCAVGVASRAWREEPGMLAVRIGSKTFTEQYVLAETLARAAEESGFPVERVESLGSTVIFDALVRGELDAYVDYTGTLWANVLHRLDVADGQTVYDDVCHELTARYRLTCVGRLGFENTYALAMRRTRAQALGIRSIGDLAKHTSVRVGGDYEFFGRPEWSRLQHDYALEHLKVRSFDASLMYEAIARDEVDVIAAFSSDGRVSAFDLLVLEDTLNVLPPYDAVLLLGPRAAKHPGLEEALQQLVGAIAVETMRAANQRVEVDRETRQAAGAWLWKQVQAHREILEPPNEEPH